MNEWKLVPVEPTHNMILAGSLDSQMTPAMADSSYRAMLNAAPQTDVQPVATVIGKFLDPTKQILTCIDVELPLLTKLYTQPPASPDVQELVEALKQVIQWVPNYPKGAEGIVGGKEAHKKAYEDARAALAKWEGK